MWFAPWPAPFIEQAYSRSAYPAWQQVGTSLSNLTGWALLDPLIVLAALGLGWQIARPLRRAASGARSRTAASASLTVVTALAGLALLFLGSWGLNYRRQPLIRQLDHEPARIDVASVRSLADTAVRALNTLHPRAHASGWADGEQLVAEMRPAFTATLGRLGLPAGVVAGRPKRTVLGAYFEAAGVAGFTNPLALDVIVTPAALPMERPALLLHEWGHLAGLAHEAEAGFFGWAAGMAGTDQMRYSAWLDLLPRLAAALPRPDAREVMRGLDEGPRADYRAIDERLRRINPTVQRAAWSGYERFLEANRVTSGLRSYDEVVGIVAGTAFDEGWVPRLRKER